MIIPSIDVQNGRAVQLVGGKTLAIDAGDPQPIAEAFALAGEIAVIDLDAAMGTGDNTQVIRQLVSKYRCRVGGGIRSSDQAWEWLDHGASKVILGTAATPDVLSKLPRERVIAALDAREGEIHVKGWQEATGKRIEDELPKLDALVGGFLITFIESEGRMQGTQLKYAEELAKLASKARITIAGGISTAAEIAALDRAGMDSQVGMAIYKGDLPLSSAIAAPLLSDRPDGLWPTVVCDELGRALGLCYSNSASLAEACKSKRGVYHSRKRGLWIKGESSGASQELLRIDLDCDRDCLRFIVRQAEPGFCHHQTRNCWNDSDGLSLLEGTILSRSQAKSGDSYTQRLLSDPDLLRSKLLEEAGELADAPNLDNAIWEAADLLYFAMVAMRRSGVDLAAAAGELARRNRESKRSSVQEGY